MPRRQSLFLAGLCVLGTCRPGDTSTPTSSASSASSTSPQENAISHLTVAGDSLRIIQHDENLPAGFPLNVKPIVVRNPYEGDKKAVATGAQLFIAYNCLDCHGAEGSGAMGPSFQDGRWHFGGSPATVFESIYQGRPDGMPAWGGRHLQRSDLDADCVCPILVIQGFEHREFHR